MAISSPSSGTNISATSGTTILVSWAGNAFVDDIAVVNIVTSGDGGQTLTAPASWHLIATGTGNAGPKSCLSAAYWHRITAADIALGNGTSGPPFPPPFTFTLGVSAPWGWHATRYSGVDPVTPIVAAATNVSASTSATVTSPAVTVPVADCVVVQYWSATRAETSGTTPNYAAPLGSNHNGLFTSGGSFTHTFGMSYETLTAPTTTSPLTETLSIAASWVVHAFALQPIVPVSPGGWGVGRRRMGARQ